MIDTKIAGAVVDHDPWILLQMANRFTDVGIMLVADVAFHSIMDSKYRNPETTTLTFEVMTAISGATLMICTPDARFRLLIDAEGVESDADKMIGREGTDIRRRCRRPVHRIKFLYH